MALVGFVLDEDMTYFKLDRYSPSILGSMDHLHSYIYFHFTHQEK